MQNLRDILARPLTAEGPEPIPDSGDMLSPEDFRSEVEREILRSDRSGVPLTLLVFDVRAPFKNNDDRQSALNSLAQGVVQCSRRTDTRGWHRNGDQVCVGLLLHNTVADKAVRLIQSVRDCLSEQIVGLVAEGWPKEVSCDVYVYPPEQTVTSDEQDQFGSNRLLDGGIALMEPRRLNDLIGRPLPRWKRALDVIGSGLGLILLSPLFAIIAIGVKLTSPGPVFYKQERIGYLGRPFMFWKFRTMRTDFDTNKHKSHLEHLIREQAGERPMQKLDSQNKAITPLGRLLRVSSMDELPQLINVFRGEMSLIGPRPCLRYEAEKYQCWHSRRFDVVPGMTGLWQVKGKNRTTFKEMIRLDIAYVRHFSPKLDFTILLMTFPTIWADIRLGLSQRQVAEVRNVR